MIVLRIYYRQTNYQQSNSNNTNMIPKQQNVNDYGFKFNHKDMASPTKYGINFTSKNQMTGKFQTNYASTGSNPVPSLTNNTSNQQSKVLGFRRKYPHHRQGNIINSKHYIAQYNTKEKETYKYQNSHPSTTESLRSDHQIFGDHPKLINKQVKLIEKLGEKSPKYNLFNQKTQTETFYDLLYKIIGILSCHARVNQRLALYRIMHYGEPVKKQCTEFYFLIRSLIIKRLKNGMLCLKLHAAHNKNKQIKQDHRYKILQKPTLYEELKEQNFQMEQSAVEKGLKFLQDRSNLRRRNQQQMIVDKNQLEKEDQPYNKKKTQLVLKKSKQKDGEINLRNDPYLTDNLKKKQNQQSQMMTKNINRIQSQQNLISGNKIQQLRTDVNTKSTQRQPSESTKILPNISINPQLNKRSVSKKQAMDRNYNLQRQSVISRQASWVILQLDQQPYTGLQNRKKLFERVETSQRKYYLNPSAYKQAEPDTNHNVLALSSRSSVDEVEIYDEQVDNEHANLFHNEQNMPNQKTLPMFQYGNNDNVIQSWDVKQVDEHNYQKNKNSISNKSNKPNVYKNAQAEFENLPSFNEKNALFYKKNENQKQTFHEKLRRENKIEKNQLKEQVDKEKKKTAQQIKNHIKSSKQSSFKISDEDYSVEEKMEQREHASKYANKVHQIEEYFTESNIFQQKNKKKIKLKQPNIRSSYDFPIQNQEIIQKNDNLQFQRPKSISASSNTLNRPLFGLKQQKVLQSKNRNPMVRSQTMLPRININYQSPRNYVLTPNTHSNKIVYQNIQNLQPQAQFHLQSQQVIMDPHPQQTKPNHYFRSQNKNYPQKATQINSPHRVYNSGSFFYGPNSIQHLQRSQNYQGTMKPERNQYRIERPNNQASYQHTQLVPGYARNSFGINSVREVIQSRPTSYSAYQDGTQKAIYKNPTYIYQNQVPHPTQSNQRYLNINKSSIKKGIDLSQNPLTNTLWSQKMLKHSKSDQLLNSLHGQGQGNEQTGHKNNRKLKVITAQYH